MGNRKQRWTAEEEEALKAGVAKHGVGKWKIILVDSEFARRFTDRSNVDLKDKWRNMTENSSTPKAKAYISSVVVPEIQNNPHVLNSKKKANDHPPRSPRNMRNLPNYTAMILDALSSLKDPSGSNIGAIASFIEQKHEVSQSFRKQLSAKLRGLVFQGKLEMVQQYYKIKDAVALGTKTPSPKQKDVRPKLLQQPSLIVSAESDIVEDAAKTVVKWIAEAENKAFLMSDALKESEIASQMAEDADAMLTLAEELYEKCYRGDRILIY